MTRFPGSDDDFSELEAELRSDRPEPRAELLEQLVARAGRGPARGAATFRRRRSALAVVFSAVVLAVFAAFGGVGYATSSVSHAAKGISKVVSGKGENRTTQQSRRRNDDGNENQGGGGNQGGDEENGDPRGGNHDGDDDPPWVHQYSRFVLVCYPIIFRGRVRFVTLVIQRQLVSFFVPPGRLGACGFGRGRDDS